MRFSRAFLVLTLVALPAWAGGTGLQGNWKFTILDREPLTLWLLKLETKNGKTTGMAQTLGKAPSAALDKVEIKGDRLALSFLINGREFNFEGKHSQANAKKILGTLMVGPQMVPTVLELTTARNAADLAAEASHATYNLDKETVAKKPGDPRVFQLVPSLIDRAAKEKATVAEVRSWTKAALQTAGEYGERWQREMAIKLAELLSRNQDYAAVAVETATLAEKLPGDAEYQLRALDVLARILKSAGQAVAAKALAPRLEKLEISAHQEYHKTALAFKVATFPGRQAKTQRAVLVELFTGAQCPPCVAADLAFDAVEKAYKPSEVVLLQYHLHIPGPDVLTNPGSEARAGFYGKLIQGTPTVLFNGRPGAPGGGGKDGAAAKFKEFRQVIDPLLEKPLAVKLEARALRQGDKIHIRALAHGLQKPDAKVHLRLALVEDWVRYKGRNGLSYHSRVVRALPGGPQGKPLTTKDTEHTVVFDLAELEKSLNLYLDNYAKNESPFLDGQRPMRFHDWTVVAFVQDDTSNEVLQAVEVAPTRE